MPSYMFDTNIFNRILDGAVEISRFRGKTHFYATHVQLDELKATSNAQRRQELLAVFEEVSGSNKISTESFVLCVSRLDEAKPGGEAQSTRAGRRICACLSRSRCGQVQRAGRPVRPLRSAVQPQPRYAKHDVRLLVD
jgi:hypothetical protein